MRISRTEIQWVGSPGWTVATTTATGIAPTTAAIAGLPQANARRVCSEMALWRADREGARGLILERVGHQGIATRQGRHDGNEPDRGACLSRHGTGVTATARRDGS